MTWPQRGWHKYDITTESDTSMTWPQRRWHKHHMTTSKHIEGDTKILWPQRGWHKHHMTTERVTQDKHHMTTERVTQASHDHIKAQRGWHKDPMTHHQSWRPGRCFPHAAGSVCAARCTDCGSAAAGAVSSCRPCAPASRGPRSLPSQDLWTVPPGQGHCPCYRWHGSMCGPSSNRGRGTRSTCGRAALECWKKERRVDEDHTMFCL